MKIIVGYVNIGNLPTKKAEEYTQEIMKKFNEKLKLPPDVQQAWVPTRDRATAIEVLDL